MDKITLIDEIDAYKLQHLGKFGNLKLELIKLFISNFFRYINFKEEI
jgi:hypothetical protein